MHDVITIGVPLIAILFGVLINQQGLRDLRASMESRFNAIESRFSALESRVEGRFNSLDARLDRMQADLSGFHRTLGTVDSEITNLKERTKP